MKRFLSSTALAASSFIIMGAWPAFSGGHSTRTIGETTALIAEAGLATDDLKDGQSGNTYFPYAAMGISC